MVFRFIVLLLFFLWRTRFSFYERLVPFSYKRLAPFSYERHAPFIKTQRFFFLKKQHVLCYGLMKSDDLTIVHA